MRALIRLFGLLCAAIGLLLGLFALFGYFTSEDTSGRIVAGVLGGMAVLLLIFGARAMRQRAVTVASSTTPQKNHPEREHTGLTYEDFEWGNPPPTRKQFGYAMNLAADVTNGMTKWMISDAIDEAIEQQRSDEPASKEQLATIREYHGDLPRTVTRGEATRVIEFLEDYYLPCPFCRIEICATDDECCACNKKLRKMKIPIKL